MRGKKIFAAGIIFILIISIYASLGPNISGNEPTSYVEGTYPEHKEFTEPSSVTEEEFWGDSTILTIYYNYSMSYDNPPKDIISYLQGTYDDSHDVRSIFIDIDRPDGHTVSLVEETMSSADINARYSLIKESREWIYNFGEEFVDEDPPESHEINPNEVLFGMADENILSDPVILKGEYSIKIEIVAREPEIDYGPDETVLKIMSYPPGPVEDLKAGAGDSEVKLQWSPPTDKGGSEIIQYNIYRATTAEGYKLIDNVTSDVTTYTDEEVTNRNLYFYKVAPINLDTRGVDIGYMGGNINDLFWRSAYENVIAYPISEERDEGTTGAYRWSMDYSCLTEDYIEERMDASVEVNRMSGGMVGMYRLAEIGLEDGLKIFEYEGGFYSYGGADVLVEYDNGTTFNIRADVERSMIDFSGTLWVNESQEGLDQDSTLYSIEKQTLETSGEIYLEYDYEYESEDAWQTSKVDLDMSWDLSLEKDFDGSAPWLCLDSTQVIFSDSYTIDYSGELLGDIDLNIHDEGTYSNESIDIDEDHDEELLNSMIFSRGINLVGPYREYTPILGSSKLGFYRIIDNTVGIDNEVIGTTRYEEDIMWASIFTNNKQVHSSEGEIHTRHYLDPLTIPGLHSILEAGFVRVDFVTDESLEQLLNNQIRAEAMRPEIQRLNQTEFRRWREMREEELRQLYHSESLTEPFWEIWDQQSGVDGTNPYYEGGPIFNVVGFVESESVEKEEVDEFMEDKEAYLESELEEDEDMNWLILVGVISLVLVLVSISLYVKKKS